MTLKTLTEIAEKIIENCQYGAGVSDIVHILQSANLKDEVNAMDSEPVYLARIIGETRKGEWSECDLEDFEKLLTKPHIVETRVLFTSQQPNQKESQND